MCGRYTNTATSAGSIRERFELNEEVPGEGLGRANVSPTQPVLAVVRERDGERHPVLRWGLAPRWATLKGGPSLINARDDKIPSSKAWEPLVCSVFHRALIVADGWIEWKHAEDPKQPKPKRVWGLVVLW